MSSFETGPRVISPQWLTELARGARIKSSVATVPIFLLRQVKTMATTSPVRTFITTAVCLFVAVSITVTVAAQQQPATPPSQEELEQMIYDREPLIEVDFGSAKLARLYLQDVNLEASDWTDADLRGAWFVDCSMSGAQITDTNARGISFEGSDLSFATISDSDLAGASITNSLLWGTTLQDVELRGAHLQGNRLSPSGAGHLMALSLALQQVPPRGVGTAATSHELAALETVASLSGDAFGFVYDAENPGAWPGQPFTQNPIVAAAEVLGCPVKTEWRLSQAVAFERLRTALEAGDVCMLPLQISFPGVSGDTLAQPLWAVATELTAVGDQVLCRLTVPPFGEMLLEAEQLDEKWRPARATLQPASAAPPEVKYPLITIQRPSRSLSHQQTVLWVIGNAIEMMKAISTSSESTLYPGLQGLQKLASDLAAADAADDGVKLVQLSAWEGLPRLSFIGARRAAADFLSQVSEHFLPQQADLLLETAMLLYSEAAMLETQWQPFGRGKLAALTTKQAVHENLQILAEVHAVEQQMLINLEEISGAR